MANKIGFLGAGRMGRGIITNLHKAGHDVSVYNRSSEPLKPLAGMGIRCVDTPAAAADGAEFIMSMVTNDEASAAVWTGPDGALDGAAQNAIAIECSTVSPDRIKALYKDASERGLAFMDCSVAGRPDLAMAGTLVVFAGGEVEVLDRARPVLEAMSRLVRHFGPVGSGNTFKLLYNAAGATQVASLAEAMAACRNAGLDLETVSEALSDGATGSPHIKLHSALMASGEYPSELAFTPAGRIKDLDYASALMKTLGVEAGVTDAARATWALVDPELRGSIIDSRIVEFVGKTRKAPDA